MKYSFAELAQNQFTRKFGGTRFGVADPYVTGYHFVFFDAMPTHLIDYTQDLNSGLSSIPDIQTVLGASCLSVTPPGGTLNTVEFTGLGGIKWSVPGNIDYGTAVSVKFLEFSKTPIGDIMHSWVKMIRDYRMGVSEILSVDDDGAGFSKKDYACVLWYWTTAPDGESVEYAACFDGVFPKKDPQDLYTSDLETVGKLEIEIEFNVDYAWHEPWVYEKCQTMASALATTGKTYVDQLGSQY